MRTCASLWAVHSQLCMSWCLGDKHSDASLPIFLSHDSFLIHPEKIIQRLHTTLLGAFTHCNTQCFWEGLE